MNKQNGSFVTDFLLLGLTDNLQVKAILFVVFLVIYLATICVNIILITVCVHAPRLHTPMYFLIVNLSVLDLLYSSVFVPDLVVRLLLDIWGISYFGCAAQMFSYLLLGCTGSVLLTGMAYDRYVAICIPFHYVNIMTSSTCIKIVAGCWLSAFVVAFLDTCFTLQLPLCGHNVINHFSCEVKTLIKMACADTFIAEMVIFSGGIIILLIPTLVIVISYAYIIMAVLNIRSNEGRKKAFSTCGSHLLVVAITYGSAIFVYMKPSPSNSDNQGKCISVFFTVGNPIWNPIIYSLRNKEIKAALQNLLKR